MMQNPVASQFTLVWVDGQGKETPVAAKPDFYRNPKISSDGIEMALTLNTRDSSDIWIRDLIRKYAASLAHNGGSRSNSAW
jgi:hypothetical protein